MIGHMNREDVISHSETVFQNLKDVYSEEQIRRICTQIVRRIGKLKTAKENDLMTSSSDSE